ncbi:MAG: hypothetical protein AAFQ98_12630 [Bacteroidota bacterium]
MKYLKFGIISCILALLAACQPEEISPVLEQEAIDKESLIVTSSEEVDALLIDRFGTSDLSLEEKLDFLSDHYAQQATEKMQALGRGASADVYVAVAQVFDGVNYFTDVDTGDGTSILLATETQFRLELISFGGCNANVYKNGNNIGGKITNAVLFECPGKKIKLFSYARWAPSQAEQNGDVNTIVSITCGGPIVPEIQFP